MNLFKGKLVLFAEADPPFEVVGHVHLLVLETYVYKYNMYIHK